ncbi:MAG: glutathione S-transferase [Verrucomicrobia bacterium]|jgi:glutathione S-transferase|nr:glutathione S-transferase [Verrucomicrobiota bacterium]
MIELYQLPYSPFCIVIRRLLEAAQVRFKIVSVPNHDRSRVWRLTRQRYYQVPVIRDGKTVVFETGPDTQVIAKYLDTRFELGLFPREWAGVQTILWRYFEHEVEAVAFKLNDIYWRENVPAVEQLGFLRHKERKFGAGCLDAWRQQQPRLLEELTALLVPCEQMLAARPFLLADRTLFVDFDLAGMLGTFLYSGHYELPACHSALRAWYARMSSLQLKPAA